MSDEGRLGRDIQIINEILVCLIHSFIFIKTVFYKNVELENGQNFKNMLGTYTRLRFIQNFFDSFLK